jgi:hypothetical protein
VNIGKLHRRAVLEVLEPSGVVPIVVTAATLIALGDQDLLRSGDIVAQVIIPAASLGLRGRLASRQLVARRNTKVEDLVSDTSADATGHDLASFDACGGLG